MPRHEIELGMMSGTDSRDPITTQLRITDSTGKVLHSYEFSEHEFMRLIRGGVVRKHDDMDPATLAELCAELTGGPTS
jgi:hypothetical protein